MGRVYSFYLRNAGIEAWGGDVVLTCPGGWYREPGWGGAGRGGEDLARQESSCLVFQSLPDPCLPQKPAVLNPCLSQGGADLGALVNRRGVTGYSHGQPLFSFRLRSPSVAFLISPGGGSRGPEEFGLTSRVNTSCWLRWMLRRGLAEQRLRMRTMEERFLTRGLGSACIRSPWEVC